MNHQIIQPCKELKDYVSHFWISEWDKPTPLINSTLYATANSLTEIAFGFIGSGLIFSNLRGHTNTPTEIGAYGLKSIFGVSLYSYAVPFLFHIPASELNNHFLSTESLLGNDGKMIVEKIALALTTEQRVNILTDYFLLQLKKQCLGDALISKAVQYIRTYNGVLNIVDLSSDFCLSQKQFERRFKACAGFNPKLYSRIVRFEAILNNRTSYTNLTEASHANGYYDQAHFIHDFKKFTGHSPTKFFALNGY